MLITTTAKITGPFDRKMSISKSNFRQQLTKQNHNYLCVFQILIFLIYCGSYMKHFLVFYVMCQTCDWNKGKLGGFSTKSI